MALERSGDAARAEESYRQLVRRDPFHFEACERLGMLYAARGERARAARMFRRAAAVRPESTAGR